MLLSTTNTFVNSTSYSSLFFFFFFDSQNLANPTALLLSSVAMLRHLKLDDKADQIQVSILKTIAEGKCRTIDLGGKSSTTEFTNAVCDNL